MKQRIGFVGVGLMGTPLARHLIAAGYPVIVHDVDPAKVEAVVQSGAARVKSPDEIPRQTNDNALAECKNGAVIRKFMGYSHIPQKHATAINRLYAETLNPYLNFHRPCYFAVDKVDAKGKTRKTYPHDQIMTPWERLKSMPKQENYLRPTVTSDALEHQANAMSDNVAAQQLQKARKLLFQSINRRSKSAA